MRQLLSCASVWEWSVWNTALSTEFRILNTGVEAKTRLYLCSTAKAKYL